MTNKEKKETKDEELEQEAQNNNRHEQQQEECCQHKDEGKDKHEEHKESKKDELAQLKQANDDLKDKYLRAVAEFDNYKKRTLKEKADLILNGGEKTISAILPVLDDFERALNDKTDDPKAIKEGMELIYKKFVSTLESLGVKKIEAKDKDFDVDYHEAVAMVPGLGDDKKGKVIDCIQEGYMLNDKVIRHAKVAVGQ
ncbi:MAG: nucleotide exchange factor GrpE [Prevotella sp.]|mgnify:FL=1|nr:nucleotide exchange factor GrpE [Prevotella sp.]MDY4625439.1 nucleotide exchange factor GrpE [Prevotella sp.]